MVRPSGLLAGPSAAGWSSPCRTGGRPGPSTCTMTSVRQTSTLTMALWRMLRRVARRYASGRAITSIDPSRFRSSSRTLATSIPWRRTTVALVAQGTRWPLPPCTPGYSGRSTLRGSLAPRDSSPRTLRCRPLPSGLRLLGCVLRKQVLELLGMASRPRLQLLEIGVVLVVLVQTLAVRRHEGFDGKAHVALG